MEVKLRRLGRDDLPQLSHWLEAPHVKRWWRESGDPDALKAAYGPAIVVAVQVDNRPSWRALEKAGYRRVWSGIIESGDPSDEGPSHVYVLDRPD